MRQGISSGVVPIRSEFVLTVNRRYQAKNFWPSEVTGKDFQEDKIAFAIPDFIWTALGKVPEEWSRRGRWFRVQLTGATGARRWAPLAGMDISSSQIQVLAAFLGLRDLEERASKTPFKELLLDRALELATENRFRIPPELADDPDRLTDALKFALMTRLYGSQPSNIAKKLATEFAPGLGDGKNLDRLLRDKKLGLDEIFHFLEACKRMATKAHRADPCAGLRLRDPLDGQPVRWNPVRTRPQKGAGDDATEIYWLEPVFVTYVGNKQAVAPTQPDERGEYPTDLSALRRMTLPCLTHMLDGAFSAIVIDGLRIAGVPDMVAIHDSWLVPDDPQALATLDGEIRDAGRPWLESLGPVYDDVLAGLTEKDQGWFYDIRAKWQERVAAGDWPKFLAKKSSLTRPKSDWSYRESEATS